MVTPVTDSRSNAADQIAHAATVLRRSRRLQEMFEAICRGGSKPKTVDQLMKLTGYTQVAVLQLGGKLADQQLVHKRRAGGITTYEKDRFYAANREKILRLATNPSKLSAFATKTSPKVATSGPIHVTVRGVKVRIGEITCDDLDQFKAVKKVKSAPFIRMSERKFKDGIQKLLGERGKFPDWGGEPNDLFTKALFKGKRVSIAFAFKGPGMQGVLTPGKLGKNGDQIQRLFRSPADIFIVQYHGQIAESVLDQMKAWATLNSVREGKKIWYGIINGDDSNRIMAAYPKTFGLR